MRVALLLRFSTVKRSVITCLLQPHTLQVSEVPESGCPAGPWSVPPPVHTLRLSVFVFVCFSAESFWFMSLLRKVTTPEHSVALFPPTHFLLIRMEKEGRRTRTLTLVMSPTGRLSAQ